MQQLLETRTHASARLADFGYHIAQDNHELRVALRSLELLAEAGRYCTPTKLDTRGAVIQVTNGWSSGVLNRTSPINPAITPMPMFAHLLQQRYSQGDLHAMPASKRVVLVVVDLQHVMTNRLELARVRAAIVHHLRGVFNAGQPVAEGTNGNVVALVDRGPLLLDEVADVRLALESDPTLSAHTLHVWIEPLADDQIHLTSHLEGLLGKIS